jgi:predicted GH43/DUF377 family glycosyl hydrolase
MFAWRKHGLVLDAGEIGGGAVSHAQTPTPLLMRDRLRVYFASRGADGKSFTAFADLAREDPMRVLGVHPQPVLENGRPGTFDDEGIMPSCAVEDGGRILLYYSGWNQRKTIPYHNSTGLADSVDGGVTFQRRYEGPILDRTPEEPYLAVTPSLLREDGVWRIWYISGLRWESIAGRFEPVYVVKDASSGDGVHWNRTNRVCIPQRHPLEAFSRPWVLKLGDGYHMWFCHRDSVDYRDGPGAYRLGYAISTNGQHWERRDELAGLPASASGWDSTMVCYPAVVRIGNRLIMFYNGNGFGRGGFGLATANLGAGQ